MAVMRTRRVRVGLTAAALAVLALGAGCSSSNDSGKAATKQSGKVTPEAVTIRAGMSDPDHSQIAVLQFMPARAIGKVAKHLDATGLLLDMAGRETAIALGRHGFDWGELA